MAVARYTVNGQLDTSTFNAGGIKPGIVMGLAPSGYHTRAHGVLVQSSGAIVIAGNSFAFDIASNPSHEYQTLARLTTSGGLDPTFGGAGTGYAINTNLFGAYAITQAANGDLLAPSATLLHVDAAPAEFGVAAFLPNGAPDTTFGMNGTTKMTPADFSGGVSLDLAMSVQADGKFVVAGYT